MPTTPRSDSGSCWSTHSFQTGNSRSACPVGGGGRVFAGRARCEVVSANDAKSELCMSLQIPIDLTEYIERGAGTEDPIIGHATLHCTITQKQ
jgi:hypothetical protein